MIRFLNSLSRAVEPFQPLDPAGKVVKMYTCGPTVYSFAHIGNFRTYLFEDLLQRHLEARGYTVNRVMNITDVDDKTIRNSRAADVPLAEFTEKFTAAFFEDMRTLRIKDANVYPAATDPENQAKFQADARKDHTQADEALGKAKTIQSQLDRLRNVCAPCAGIVMNAPKPDLGYVELGGAGGKHECLCYKGEQWARTTT